MSGSQHVLEEASAFTEGGLLVLEWHDWQLNSLAPPAAFCSIFHRWTFYNWRILHILKIGQWAECVSIFYIESHSIASRMLKERPGWRLSKLQHKYYSCTVAKGQLQRTKPSSILGPIEVVFNRWKTVGFSPCSRRNHWMADLISTDLCEKLLILQ